MSYTCSYTRASWKCSFHLIKSAFQTLICLCKTKKKKSWGTLAAESVGKMGITPGLYHYFTTSNSLN